MQRTLYQYLVLHNYIILPGIGRLALERKPAAYQVADKIFLPPAYSIIFDNTDSKPVKDLFSWIASVKKITEWESVKAVNDFAYKIKEDVSATGEFSWDGAGVFKRNEKGELYFETINLATEGWNIMPAEKVIREKTELKVLVGESEITTNSLEEFISEEVSSKDYGWIAAVVLVILLFMFVGWYFSENGIHPFVTGNKTFIGS